jgi:hypothetical protein
MTGKMVVCFTNTHSLSDIATFFTSVQLMHHNIQHNDTQHNDITFSITTLSIMTFSMMTLSIKGIFAKLSKVKFNINDTQRKSTNTIILSVIVLNVTFYSLFC